MGDARQESSKAGARGVGDVSWGEAVRVWAVVGINSFGGPTGQIAVMHRVLVEEKRWISESRFLHALNYCMLLPGPEAMQLATYVGWLKHRTAGGLLAGTFFVLPGFISILALSLAYSELREVKAVAGLLFGLKAAILAIVAGALARIGRKVLRSGVMYGVAAASFMAIFIFAVPFPAIIIGAAVLGIAGDRLRPGLFGTAPFETAEEGAEQEAAEAALGEHTRPSTRRALGVLAVWLPLWLGPVALLRWWLGPENVFAQEGVFFSKAAVVTFGGAYAVLAYIAQQAVELYGWLEPGEMVAGLAMAESTPGPLIQVVQYVGYMGAYREAGELHPITAGVLASVLVTWVTFAPCFLWIFLGGPYVEQVRGNRSLGAALSVITAAVVGVILNLAAWFALHVLFARVEERRWGPVRYFVPEWGTVDVWAIVIAAVAAYLLMRRKWGVMRTLGVSALLGIVGAVAGRSLGMLGA